MKHQRSESLRKLQRLQKGLPEEDEDLGQIFTIRRCPSTDPGETRQCTGRGGGRRLGVLLREPSQRGCSLCLASVPQPTVVFWVGGEQIGAFFSRTVFR